MTKSRGIGRGGRRPDTDKKGKAALREVESRIGEVRYPEAVILARHDNTEEEEGAPGASCPTMGTPSSPTRPRGAVLLGQPDRSQGRPQVATSRAKPATRRLP